MRKTYDYSIGMMEEAVESVNNIYNAHYRLVKDTAEAYFEGFSPKETRYRLELVIPFLQECPTKAHLHWNQEKECWTLWRDV